MQASLTCLGQCTCQHRCRNTIKLGVQLNSGHELAGTGDLEVHITQGIFSAQNIGQRGVTGFAINLVRDKTHCDTRNRCAQGHTGIEQRQG